jgi:hypothetical protein
MPAWFKPARFSGRPANAGSASPRIPDVRARLGSIAGRRALRPICRRGGPRAAASANPGQAGNPRFPAISWLPAPRPDGCRRGVEPGLPWGGFSPMTRVQQRQKTDRDSDLPAMPRRFAWASLPDEELLQLRLQDLHVTVEGTWVERCVMKLYDELEERGVKIRPHVWLSDEWFSPDNTPGIAIPFYLTHPRLMRLERKMIAEVEGGSEAECMRILRHEAGHVVQHSYKLQRKRRWQKLFGRSSVRYPNYYRPNPSSKNYVQHLRLWYAQSHPDEDFAETFAVWLTPGQDWRNRYQGWKALQKLEYMDELMQSLAGKPPLPMPEYRVADYDCLNVKLKTYYARKRKVYEDSFPDFYDNDLRQLFHAGVDVAGRVKASVYLRHHRRQLEHAVCQWTNERKYRVNKLLTRLTDRCDQLGLYLKAYDPKQNLQVSAYITTLVMNHLFTGKFKRTK